MENESQRPPVPGMGRVPNIRRVLVISLMAILLAAVLGTYAFWTRFLQNFDDGPTARGQSVGRRQSDKWDVKQHIDLQRSGLHELDQKAELIWKNIDALEREIDAYQRRYNSLEEDEEGRRLMEDKWFVRYFVDKLGEPLPHEEVARHCRVRLNELMFTVKEALAKTEPTMKKGAYEILPEIERKVELIKFEVTDAKKKYTTHRLFLDERAASVAEGGPVTPKNMKQAAELMRREAARKHFEEPWGDNQPDSTESDSQREEPMQPKAEPRRLDSSTLLDDVNRSESGVPDHFIDTTLGRDTVRDRDEPPRRRLGQ
jgi:hypothetical protein